MRSTEAQDILNIENLDKFANISEIRPKNKLIELTETKGDQIYDIYMDGSRIISDTGFTVCILKKRYINRRISIPIWQLQQSSRPSWLQLILRQLGSKK
ncbi:hypothetical protein AVEN_7152-1 [Araneus ventricosus]|uniref:Uncharacterized protein n=1 Tax=Araneus ventricosus TaxID=182803 RepID=A0A4Y2JJM7_ARAVE|nr:hypothetical protein AVEN_7152-1 [Araneus ventricosus]